MTMLLNRLNLIENSISEKEALIEQLRVEISQMQQHVHAVKGVSELCENLRALALQTWMSVYTVCPEEEQLIMQELEQARLDAKSKVEMGIAQLPEMVEPQPEPTPEPEVEVTVLRQGSGTIEAEVIEEETQATVDVDVVAQAEELAPVVDSESIELAAVLSSEQLDKDHMDFVTLKKLAATKGVKARKRLDIEKELAQLGVTQVELDEVLAGMEF